MAGAPWTSEVQVKDYERVAPSQPLVGLKDVTLGLISTGGLVPRGNPDRQVAARAEFFVRYPIQGLRALSVKDWESVHGGFGTQHLNTRNPNWALPLPAVRELEARGEIRGVYPYFFSTTGNGTAVKVAQGMGRSIANELKEAGVSAALLVAT
jgi:glycine reductase